MSESRSLALSTGLVVFLAVACSFLLSCGGGAGKDDGADTGSGDVSSDGGNTGGGGGATTPPPPPAGLTGGVLATFQVGAESFKWWVTEPATAQRLVDASTGAAPAIQLLGVLVEPGAGTGAHNAPWNWHASPQAFRLLINPTIAPTICFPYWALPSQVEAGFAAGPPYPCVDANAGANWAEMRMNVALTDLQDLR